MTFKITGSETEYTDNKVFVYGNFSQHDHFMELDSKANRKGEGEFSAASVLCLLYFEGCLLTDSFLKVTLSVTASNAGAVIHAIAAAFSGATELVNQCFEFHFHDCGGRGLLELLLLLRDLQASERGRQ
jgi:hypothetical protein